jgi:hypothetical protein
LEKILSTSEMGSILALIAPSPLNLNWCIHSLIYLQSKAKRGFPPLLKASVKGLTTVGISSTSETPPLSQSLQSLHVL